MSDALRSAVVAIGRNEGERLVRCFDSIGDDYPAVYVDSGSTDGSVAEADKRGIQVVHLSTDAGFTAARARNAGWRAVAQANTALDYIQFVDGDCEFAPGWIARAIDELDADPTLCAVFGRRRERFPNASVYNALCDDEWNVPVGFVEACGGDVLFRLAALKQADGYSDDLIAGEEPDLCLRLGQKGWKIRRIDAEMTLHDAAITTARQWWLRTRRAGHAFTEHVARHGPRAFASWRAERNRIGLWGVGLPLLFLVLVAVALVTRSGAVAIAAAAVAAAYPAQVARLTFRDLRQGRSFRFSAAHGFWLVAGRFAQAGGMARYWINRARRRRNSLIEYKGA
ncbi:MAG: glycosyltransferase family 2 protein [Sphingobium sp.]|nr:glycosyltransferase family 2 protein [Sphingobium sp.]